MPSSQMRCRITASRRATATRALAMPRRRAIRKMVYTTNAVESLRRSLRKIIKTRGSFPTDGEAEPWPKAA